MESHGWEHTSETQKEAIIAAIASGSTPAGPAHLEIELVGSSPAARLAFDRLAASIDELASRGLRSVRLAGDGDPLTHPDIDRILDRLASRGVVVDHLATRGLALTEELVDVIVASRCRQLLIDLFGADKEDYHRLTLAPPECFERLLEAVRRLHERRRGEPYPAVAVRFHLDRLNIAQMARMYALGLELEAERIVLRVETAGPPIPHGTQLRAIDHYVTRTYFEQVLEQDLEHRRLDLELPSPVWKRMEAEVRRELGGEKPCAAGSFSEGNGQCFFGFYSAALAADGHLYPCRKLKARSSRPLGNLDASPATVIWKGSRSRRLRAEMRDLLLTEGRVLYRPWRFRLLRRRCVQRGSCSLKNRHFCHDEAFYLRLGLALEAARRRSVRWLGWPSELRRALEVFAYRLYGHTLVETHPPRMWLKRQARALRRWRHRVSRLWRYRHRLRREKGARLHIGCGATALPGWVNIDLQDLPGVDLVADVTEGLRFTEVSAVYAEHFLEHLEIGAALGFLKEMHRVLAPDGWLRLSTPNLDWVWQTHYRGEADSAAKPRMALDLNRAFQGWRHRFLWNRELLAQVLEACGFCDLRWCRHGESDLSLFQGIERHEAYADSPWLTHVIIAETRKGPPRPARFRALRRLIQTEFLDHLEG